MRSLWEALLQTMCVCFPMIAIYLAVYCFHKLALFKIGFGHFHRFGDAGTTRQIALIDLMQSHPAWVIAGLMLSIGLLGLTVRRSPTWAVCMTFAALLSPVLVYGSVCMDICGRLIVG